MLKEQLTIIIADDDSDDRLLICDAIADLGIQNPVIEIENGEELLGFLESNSEKEESRVKIGLILLDLNMPKMDGREALEKIKSNPKLKQIPVVILTTSNSEEDIANTYGNGANSYIVKPVTMSGFLSMIKSLHIYWLEIVNVPDEF